MRILDILTEAKKKKATKTRLDPKCWKNKKIGNPKTKVKGGVRVNNCVPKESVKENVSRVETTVLWKDPQQYGVKQVRDAKSEQLLGGIVPQGGKFKVYTTGGSGGYKEYDQQFNTEADSHNFIRIQHGLSDLKTSTYSELVPLGDHRPSEWLVKNESGKPLGSIRKKDDGYYALTQIDFDGVTARPKKFNSEEEAHNYVRKVNKLPSLTQGVAEGDVFFIEAGNTLIETTVVYESKGRIIIDLDDTALKIIESAIQVNEVSVGRALAAAGKRGLQAVGKAAKVPVGGAIAAVNGLGSAVAELPGVSDKTRKQWRGRATRAVDGTIGLAKKAGTLAKKAGTSLGHAVTKALGEDVSNIEEAKYHGKEVPLGKRLPGDVKKSKVYVRKPNGKIVKVNFGDKTMRIKKSNPKRRKSFRARHNCKNPGPRWKARYWSCRAW